jgi:thiol:disulfide interchange protein DsbD
MRIIAKQRTKRKIHILLFIVLLILAPFVLDTAEGPVRRDHTTVELVSDIEAVAPGIPFSVAVQFKLDKQWHVYWRNPGDTGLAPKFIWKLPDGFQISEIQWPYPKKIMVSGLANFAYEDNVLLMATITPPDSLNADDVISIGVQADWLVCKEECIPGEANLDLNLQVGESDFKFNQKWVDQFNMARSQLPISNSDWSFQSWQESSSIYIKGTNPLTNDFSLQEIQFFPSVEQIYDYAATQTVTFEPDGFIISVPLALIRAEDPTTVTGILVSESGWRGGGSEKALRIDVRVDTANKSAVMNQSIFIYLLFAFAGGIILNLMPCVLPVLSIKVLGLIGQVGEDSRKILLHGLLYALGVIVSFWILAGMLLILRAGGEQLGWGFQLQSPLFIFILSAFLFMLGLSLFGVFEIGLVLAGLGTRAQGKVNKTGSILSGIMATVVATPCTAPFMGSALGFAVTQPVSVSMAVFTFLALGMAAPYVILTAFPKLLRFIPKPGAWMESFKQFLGFLMMATVVWLIWILSLQQDTDAVVILLIVLLFLSIGAWILGRWGSIQRKTLIRRTAYIIATTFIAGSMVFGLGQVQNDDYTGSSLEWEPFVASEVQERRALGKPVFIDFTAAWCLSCKVNERVALADQAVIKKMLELNISTFKADWTTRNAEITHALAQYGRNSVPLYILYGPQSEEALILPEILTPGIVLNALNQIETM